MNSLLDDISRDRAHQIRHAFDRATFALIDKLKNDPEMAARADAVKSYLKEDEAFLIAISVNCGGIYGNG